MTMCTKIYNEGKKERKTKIFITFIFGKGLHTKCYHLRITTQFTVYE